MHVMFGQDGASLHFRILPKCPGNTAGHIPAPGSCQAEYYDCLPSRQQLKTINLSNTTLHQHSVINHIWNFLEPNGLVLGECE